MSSVETYPLLLNDDRESNTQYYQSTASSLTKSGAKSPHYTSPVPSPASVTSSPSSSSPRPTTNSKLYQNSSNCNFDELAIACMRGDLYSAQQGVNAFLSLVSTAPSRRQVFTEIMCTYDNTYQLTAIQLSAFFDQPLVLEYLLTKCTELCICDLEDPCATNEKLPDISAIVNQPSGSSERQFATALMLAHSVSIAEILLEHGARLEERDHQGMTALHYQASSGNALITSKLLSAGAQVNVVDSKGRFGYFGYSDISNIFRYIQIYSDIFKYIQIYSNIHSCVHIFIRSFTITLGSGARFWLYRNVALGTWREGRCSGS